MKEGKKLGTNEAKVEKYGQLGALREVYFQRVGFFNTAFEKSHLPEQLFDNWKLLYLPSALTATPFSHK